MSNLNSINYSLLQNNTKFSENQLKIIHQNFSKYSKQKQNHLNLKEFKESCGIIGKTNKSFIIKRLMYAINKAHLISLS